MAFKPDDVVEIFGTTDSNLDGQIGTIRGVVSSHPNDIHFYIVELEKPLPEKWKCISIISSCLRFLW